MKTKRLGIILLVAVSTLLMLSCKKKNESPQPEEGTGTSVTPVTNGMFTAKINGTVKTFGTNFYIENGGIGTTITGIETGGTSITLAFLSVTTGTYEVDGILTQAYYYVGSTQHSATSGKIIVTKVENNKMSGTFYFSETDEVNITGVFTKVPKK